MSAPKYQLIVVKGIIHSNWQVSYIRFAAFMSFSYLEIPVDYLWMSYGKREICCGLRNLQHAKFLPQAKPPTTAWTSKTLRTLKARERCRLSFLMPLEICQLVTHNL